MTRSIEDRRDLTGGHINGNGIDRRRQQAAA